MMLTYLKALHIIFVVTWFAGLFYMGRLFIYFAEAESKPEPEKSILQKQYKLMQKRLWFIIAWPSAILTLIFGFGIAHPYFDNMPIWLTVKLILVGLLFVYHHVYHFIFKQQRKDIIKYSSSQLRVLNEVATLFLFAIVFLAVLKNSMNMVYGMVGLIALAVILFVAVKLYKKSRKSA